jgi:hypothetical protein
MSEIAETINCNATVFSNNTQNEDTDEDVKENDGTLHERQTRAVGRVVVDDEIKIIRFCKLVTDRPLLTFGRFHFIQLIIRNYLSTF